ncbi:hypothetical protein F4677DRAFT_446686 [Hypoxylon crocopeplum]|nr:hypothetical protein F4677DRAFT_446686 [Hypoxylon crocopeplum]
MLFSALSLLTSAAAVSSAALPSLSLSPAATKRDSGSTSVTPHDRYSSSVGVLGCKINVNRVAYWPSFPSCDSICIKVSANGRSVHLLRIDQSGGAHDISYDAWNYLVTGASAADQPTQGGGIAATWEDADMSACADLITEPQGRLAFSAANSMNFISSCSAGTWVGQNHALYNILNSQCTYGYDEVCTLEQGANQPTCPHQLGTPAALTTQPVYNMDYGTGKLSLAQ